MIRPVILTAAALLLVGATTARAADPKLDTDDQKTVYALGLALSESLKPYELTAEEMELLKAGLMDGLQNFLSSKPLTDNFRFIGAIPVILNLEELNSLTGRSLGRRH